MAKKKETKVEETKPLDFSNKSLADCYEGLVCLDIKLSKLIEIMDGIGNYLENKKNGTLGIS